MTGNAFSMKNNITRLVALVIISSLYGLAKLPGTSEIERSQLSSRFDFKQEIIESLHGYPKHSIRNVNPSLEHISSWISSVGAAVALNDLDGDGLSNDLCLVDTQTNQVSISPVPGTPNRYAPIVLKATPLPFDSNTMAPMGCLPGDFNEDGAMDVLVYYWGRTPIIFFKIDDKYVAAELTNSSERWFTNAATTADFDGDGHPDLVIANYFPDNARILDANATNKEQMQASMSRAYNGGSTRFFLWHKSSAAHGFKEVDNVLDENSNYAWTLALGAADLDGDLLPELYMANDFGPDRLLHNNSEPGKLKFKLLEGMKFIDTPSSKRVGLDSFKGMGVDFADLNGDQFLDIFVSNIAAEYALQESHFAFLSTGEINKMKSGKAPYVDKSESLGLSRSNWSWGTRMADFDNDGDVEVLQATGFVKGNIDRWPELQELAIGNDDLLRHPNAWLRIQPGDDLSGYAPNPFYVKSKTGRYVDISKELNIDTPQVSRGIAVADVDGDGDLDFAVANQWEVSRFYRNDCPKCGSFLGLHLVLPLQKGSTQINAGHPVPGLRVRPAIGAEARVYLPDGRILVSQVDGGNGHSGKRSPELHFGLGDVKGDENLLIEVRWRDLNGKVKNKKLQLNPGWYTIQLGTS